MDSLHKKHIDTLVKYGILIPFDQRLKLYHGRARSSSEKGDWKVKPMFKNGGNSTGNYNVYSISTLSTADYQTASDFARERVFRNATPEVHRIVTDDKEAMIFDYEYDLSKLKKEDKDEVMEAFKGLVDYKMSTLTPIPFEYRRTGGIIFESLKQKRIESNTSLLSEEDIDDVYKNLANTEVHSYESPITRDIVHEIASSMNTKVLFKYYPDKLIQKYALEPKSENRNNMMVNNIKYPINMNYIASVLSNSHIVGVRADIDSATLDRVITGYYIFDLDKVNTEKAMGEKYQDIFNSYNEISKLFSSFKLDKKLLETLHQSPEYIMENIAYNSIFENYYRTHDGNWEGFTIGQHTETVLRAFDDTYTDIPVEIQDILKLAIITHDMDKGVSRQNGLRGYEFQNQSANKFYDILKVPKQLQTILKFMISESQIYTSQYFINQNPKGMDSLQKRCTEVLKEITKKPSSDMIRGFMNMCIMLQTCDGGAYTRYGITRDENTNCYYRNGNDRFTQTFKKPPDLASRKLVLKVDNPLDKK